MSQMKMIATSTALAALVSTGALANEVAAQPTLENLESLIETTVKGDLKPEEQTRQDVTVDVAAREARFSGDIQVKYEFEDAKASGMNDDQVSGRLKPVLQMNLRFPELPSWTFYYHSSQERLYSGGLEGTQDGDWNDITEFKPRYERNFGQFIGGIELGYVSESRAPIQEYQVRPYARAKVTDKCTGEVSVRLAEKDLPDPDYHYTRYETGLKCFTGPRTIMGVNLMYQDAENLNDNGGVVDLDGNAWAMNGVTKESSEGKIGPFIHHRFNNEVGLTVTAEYYGVKDDALNDYYELSDISRKLIAFVEYPIKRNVIVFAEANLTRGSKTVNAASSDPAAVGHLVDGTYTKTGGYFGITYLF